MSLELLRGGEPAGPVIDFLTDLWKDHHETRRVRCPHCEWTPQASHRWSCLDQGPPEFFEGGCGTSWNTFQTAGRCPGCQHQWQWTICLSCLQWAPHDDWYESDDSD